MISYNLEITFQKSYDLKIILYLICLMFDTCKCQYVSALAFMSLHVSVSMSIMLINIF